ncbi:Transcriptional regulator [Seminavis robusta]|uniref:Transcriptional regulator n=1 Tax=Seminavis robusta TaxID=568900 RepID=A0A9N8HMB6_9STRA|nr:Transcriptional regulator [Seminavis robusta]|eukprot:Sro883_g215480.1 Transcriptional regulator (1331) ;mRNA; f:23168-27449
MRRWSSAKSSGGFSSGSARVVNADQGNEELDGSELSPDELLEIVAIRVSDASQYSACTSAVFGINEKDLQVQNKIEKQAATTTNLGNDEVQEGPSRSKSDKAKVPPSFGATTTTTKKKDDLKLALTGGQQGSADASVVLRPGSPGLPQPTLQREQPRQLHPCPGAYMERPGGNVERADALRISLVRPEDHQAMDTIPQIVSVAADSIPQAVPVAAELAQDEEATAMKLKELEAKTIELAAKTEEIERLKRDLQNLQDKIHVAEVAPVTAVPAIRVNSRGRCDVTNEVEAFVLDPTQEALVVTTTRSSAPAITTTNSHQVTANKLRFASLGLIGRSQEEQTLAACLHRATQTKTRELVLISGNSGVGKTALAMTLQAKTCKEKGLFISGKFDFCLRDDPYTGVASACRDLCSDLSLIDEFCDEIVEELGSELTILVKILPELQTIARNRNLPNRENNSVAERSLGHRQGLDESKKQIAYAFRRFFRAVCSFFPCLVLSLDDIQWADTASLDLLESLVTDDKISNLVVVGCFRANEVDETHLVSKMIRDLQANGNTDESFQITQVSIGNLELPNVRQMLIELLSMKDSDEVAALAQVCHKKTHGNAFFLVQFVSHLHEKGLLEYSWRLLNWTWDVPAITAKTGSTSNVVDLLKNKMEDLSNDSMVRLLPILACMGSSVEESTLAVVWDACCKDQGDHDAPLTTLLATAVEEGFLEKRGQSTYQFVHDKVQEASFSLVDSEHMVKLKSTVGKVLAEFDETAFEVHLFVAVNLLNEGCVPTSLRERIQLASLNLQAAKKAVVSSAFVSASKYALAGIELLPACKWGDEHYQLTLELFCLASEVQGYLGHVKSMEYHCDEVKAHARCLSDTFRVQNVLQDSLLNRHLNEEALALGLNLLKKLGHNFPKGQWSIKAATVAGILRTKVSISPKFPERIESLPSMTDPMKIQIMHTLDKCCTAAYLLMHDIFALLIFKNIQLTLRYGLSQYSPPAFSFLACILVGGLNDFNNASMVVSCAEKMMAKSRNTASRTAFVSSCLVLPWVDPSQNCLKKLVNGYYDGLFTGDTDSSMWCINVYIGIGLQSGRNLALLEADCAIYIKQMQEFERVKIAKFTQMYAQVIANLTQQYEFSATEEAWPLVGLDEHLYNDDDIMVDLGKEFQNRLYAILGEHAGGAELSIARGDRFLKGAPGCYHHIPDAFHRGLSLFAMARETKKRKYKRHAQKQRALIGAWTKKGNPNTIHYKHLLDAENAALKGRVSQAKEFYRKAVATSSRAGFVHDAALACERFAEYLLHDLEDKESAALQMREAIRFYAEWGATRKVDMVRNKYPDLLRPN